MTDAFDRATEAARALADATGVERHHVAIVLGSGWSDAVGRFGDVRSSVPTSDLPHFPGSTVEGHDGVAASVETPTGQRVLALSGRAHGYEGHTVDDVVHGVRTAVIAGCDVVILTNSAGGIGEGLAVGEPVLIADHLNLTGVSPLTGPNRDDLGPRFPDMTDCWSRELRALARSLDSSLREGVYAGVNGPQYETPAEITMMQRLGADLVGMSTVHEAVAAHHLGAQVLGVSLVTNLAAGLGDMLDHADVLSVAAASAERMGLLLADLIGHVDS